MPDPKKLITLPPDLLTAIDDYRFRERLPSRSEAIRRLIEAGLKIQKKEKERTK